MPKASHLPMVSWCNSLFVFGGQGNDNSVYQFNTCNYKWKKIPSNTSSPSRRSGHSAVIYNNKMIVFGGYDGL